MSYSRGAGLGIVIEVNPLDGKPLPFGWTVVRGPSWTGPRATVVNLSDRASWPRWISQDSAGRPVDDSQTTSATFEGGQTLPELTAEGVPPWVWLVVLGVAYALVFGKRKSRGDW